MSLSEIEKAVEQLPPEDLANPSQWSWFAITHIHGPGSSAIVHNRNRMPINLLELWALTIATTRRTRRSWAASKTRRAIGVTSVE